MSQKIWITALLVSFLLPQCRTREGRIPLVNVNFSINVDLPEFIDLQVPTGSIYLFGGSEGIVVYRLNNDDFVAWDRHSTYQVEDNCRVTLLEDNFTLKDECSESSWSILDGTVISGPATAPLQPYQTFWNPPILTITN